MRVNRSVLFTVLGAGIAGYLLSGVDAAVLVVDRAGWVTREFASRSVVDDVPVVMVLTYLMPVLVGLFSLLLVRRWPYVLLAGGLLTVPPLAVEVWPDADLPSIVIVAGLVAFPLLLVGVLSCAQVLFHSGFPGWGAAVAAATYGVQLVAAVPVSTTGDNVGLGVGWYASLTLAGLGGLTLAVRGYLRQGRTAAVAAGSAIDASRPRDTIAGMLAAGERVEHEVAGCGVVVDEGGGQIGRHAASGRSFGPTTGADYVVVNAKNHCGVGCQCTSFRYTNIDDHLC